MNDGELSPHDEVMIRLMELAPYRALTLRIRETLIDGKMHFLLTKDDFTVILRHFLRFLPFDDQSYLESSRDVEKAIAEGRYRGTPFQHFIDTGYFGGRRPVPNYLPEEHDFEAATQVRPRAYFVALFGATAAYAENDYAESERFLRAAVAVCPRSFQANRLLGYVLYRTARVNEALAPLAAAAEIRNDLPEICLWLSSAYQILAMPEARAERLADSVRLYGTQNVSVARAYADSMRELGHVKRAHFIYAALPVEGLGGVEVAAKDRVARDLADARRRVRALTCKTRHSTLSQSETIELAQELVKTGFKRPAALLVNRIVAERRQGPSTLDSATAVRLAEAARMSQGIQGAIRILSVPQISTVLDADGIAYKASLLYRSGRFQAAIELLSAPAGTVPSTELALQHLVLAHQRAGQPNTALDICHSWMTRHPESTRWAGLALLILASRASLPFMHVPSGKDGHAEWSAGSGHIPARIVQFWSDPLPPPDVAAAMSTWRENNPGFRYDRFSDSSAREFFASHFGPRYAEAFDACTHPAMRADYFRLGYLCKLGGFYADADERSALPLSLALAHSQEKSAIFVFRDRAYIPNSPLCCAPQHPLIVEALEAATSDLLVARRQQRRFDTWQVIGPGLITRLVARELLSGEERRVQLLGKTCFLREIDASRVSVEGRFDYKNSRSRNWRLQ